MALTIVFIILAVVALAVIAIYNALIRMVEAVRNNERQIDIQLDRRYKVFESLVNAVRKYMDYEKSTLKEVVSLRNQALAAKSQGDAAASMAAENKISGILSGLNLNVVFERYPDLKAKENVMQLQEEIVSTENKLAYAKQAYNDSIEKYNAKKKSFFESIVVKIFSGKLDFNFPYWNLSQEKIKEKEDYTVNL